MVGFCIIHKSYHTCMYLLSIPSLGLTGTISLEMISSNIREEGPTVLIIRIIHKLRKNSKQKTHGPHRSHEQFLTNTRSLRQCYMIIFICTEEEILIQNVLCHVCINLSSGSGEDFLNFSIYFHYCAIISWWKRT